MSIRSFVEMLRLQKRKGKLKAVFRAYQWWRANAISPINLWWKSKVLALLCRFAIWMLPESAGLHLHLGAALEREYHQISARRGFNAARLTATANDAIRCYQKVVILQPDCLRAYQRLSALLLEMNRVDEALEILTATAEVQRNLANARQLDALGLRFLATEHVAGNIGVMAMLDGYVKAEILGWRPKQRAIALIPDGHPISNPCFLDYWKRYITVITDNKLVNILSPLAPFLEDRLDRASIQGRTLVGISAYASVQKQWYIENRAPLLTLTDADARRGTECLRKFGMPQSAWFVCLHVRDAGFKDDDRITDNYRNSDVDAYLLAIKTIVAKGGWVIHMGDPAMKTLPAMEHVIDYAHSDIRSDWMDIFCCARCRFFLGTSSGLYTVAAAFGVPCVQTNYLPLSTLWFSSQDLFIPKLCRSYKDARLLSFAEQLSPPLSTSVVQSSYDLANVEILDNTPDEICDVVLEMLARLDREIRYSEDDERLQEQFNSLTRTCGTLVGLKNVGINCRIGRNFLRDHATLLSR